MSGAAYCEGMTTTESGRPATRAALLEASAAEFATLLAQIDALPDAEALFAHPGRDRDVREVLAHLDAWHRLLLGWHAEGMGGGTPDLPAPGYGWDQLDALNLELRDRYAGRGLAEVRADCEASHDALDLMVASHSEGELFVPGAYPWTGGDALAALADECGPAHYRWAVEEIRRAH